MKKVLLITYYWPPAPGAGAHRIHSFARYLPEFGIHPLVLLPESSVAPSPLSIGSCITAKGWDPTKGRTQSPSAPSGITTPTTNKLMEWIRLNAFIPDTKIGWFKPAFRRACKIIEAEQPEYLFTSAPPYTVHLIGKALHKKYGLPWIADFRDPWLENHAYNTAHRMYVPLLINQRMEKAVLQAASHITTALDSQRHLLVGKVNRQPDAFTTIKNGFEPSAWSQIERLKPTDRLYISHFGTIYQEGLDLELLSTLATTIRNTIVDLPVCMRLYGAIPSRLKTRLEQALPAARLDLSSPVPHAVVEDHLQQQQILLLIVNHGPTHAYSHPSKVFEYMASGNPILAIGPSQHEVMDLLREHAPTRSYICQDPGDVRTAVNTIAAHWRAGTMPTTPFPKGPFTRKALTEKLAGILHRL